MLLVNAATFATFERKCPRVLSFHSEISNCSEPFLEEENSNKASSSEMNIRRDSRAEWIGYLFHNMRHTIEIVVFWKISALHNIWDMT